MRGCEPGRVHSTAIVSDQAKIGADVTIGAFSIVYDNVEIGDGSTIGPRVTLGEPVHEYYTAESSYRNPTLRIGAGALIRSGSVIYAGSSLEAGFETGHNICVRERTRIGRRTRINTGSVIMGDCTLGDYVHLYEGVIMGRHTEIGNYVWIHPYVMLADCPYPPSDDFCGPKIEDYAVLCACSVLLPGVRVGAHAVVGARTRVQSDVPPGAIVSEGIPMRTGQAARLRSSRSGQAVYPWPPRFGREMPWSDVGYEAWCEASTGVTSCESPEGRPER